LFVLLKSSISRLGGFILNIYYKNLAGSLLEKMALQAKTLPGFRPVGRCGAPHRMSVEMTGLLYEYYSVLSSRSAGRKPFGGGGIILLGIGNQNKEETLRGAAAPPLWRPAGDIRENGWTVE
jgi:hypothetical protein